MSKVHWSDFTPEEQAEFGDGCGSLARGLKVPDFIFEASCKQHDAYYYRGGWPWHKVEADVLFYWHMLKDATRYPWLECLIYTCLATIYFLAVSVISWPFFTFGRWRTKEEIMAKQAAYKMVK